MATIVEAEPQVALARFRWTTAEFDRLVASGFIREGTRIFLWDGEIIVPMAEDISHANACDNARRALEARLPDDQWTVSPGHPLALSDGFLPQPDIVVARGSRSTYRRTRPTAQDAALVVEVANTSLAYDTGEYLRHYALEGIPLYWIVNIKARRVEVYSRPDREAGRYEVQANYGIGNVVPLTLGEAAFEPIAVEAILRDSIEG